MFKTINFCLFISIFLCTACQENAKTLPILGNTDEVDGKKVYHQIPDFEFINQDSTLVTNETFQGKAYISDHFFISCPTICPKLSKSMLRIHDKFKNESNLLLLSHSIDTKYDTIPRLKKYATSLGVTSDKWHFVTGDKEEIFDIAEDYFNIVMDDADAPGGYNHSGRLILVDNNRRIRAFCDGTDPESVDDFMKDIALLLQEMRPSKT